MNMDNPLVCILVAGRGTRMGQYGEVLNKSLLPINGKAILSHIIELYPAGARFVIGLGNFGQQVRDYMAAMHPKTEVSFVEVDNWAGPGSGPGHSLWCCRHELNRPFYFMPGDGIYHFDWNVMPSGNWAGVANVPEEVTPDYCNFRLGADGRITQVLNKIFAKGCRAFTGALHIEDTEAFWQAMADTDNGDSEVEIATALATFAENHWLNALESDWEDLGTIERYRARLGDDLAYDFSKTNEFLYFGNDRVVKFFADARITKKRVEKAALRPAVFPPMLGCYNGFYTYRKAPGSTLYENLSPALFKQFLAWMEAEVWPLNGNAPDISKLCRVFYHDKTMERVAQYGCKYPGHEPLRMVNGRLVPSVPDLLAAVPWDQLERGVPAFIHGDLQFDNVLWGGNGFVLLDWRQDFAGSIAAGDLYYDLAKMLGGIILNYDYVKLGLLRYTESDGCADVDFAQRFRTGEYIAILEDYIRNRGLDLRRVRILVGLIYLNMAPLHHPPFDLALLALGSRFLADALKAEAN